MASLNDSFQSLNFLLAPFVVVLYWISVNGRTYKSAINRPIKIQTHHVGRKHMDRLTDS